MFLHKAKQPTPEQLGLIERRMVWATSFLIVRFRFVHEVLSITSRKADPRVGTMAVGPSDGGFIFFYNPALVGLGTPDCPGLTDAELIYMMAHEVMHMTFHHCTLRRFDNHEIGGMAKDAAINELIPIIPGVCERPKDKDGKLVGVFVDELAKMKEYKGIAFKQTSEYYYEFFKSRTPSISFSKNKDGSITATIKNPQSGEETKIKVNQDDHGKWKEDEVADERIRAKIGDIDKRGLWNQMWGNQTAGNVEMIRAAQIRKINWASFIRQHYGNQIWKTREATRKKPNRRTGMIHPGTKKLSLDRHLVGVDTSASMDSGILSKCLSAINSMVDYIPIDLMEFDTKTQTDPRPFDRKKTKFDFTGRGGTDFQPVLDMAKKRKYRSLLIITDGEAASVPQPVGTQVVWVLPQGKNPPVDWGKRIHMTNY